MIDATAMRGALEWIRGVRRPALLSHAKPDGDAVGSLAALRAMLRRIGLDATAILFDELPDRYSYFRRFDPMTVAHDAGCAASLLDAADGVIVVDTCSFKQLEPAADWIGRSSAPKLAIDHHGTRDDLADVHLIDESAPATCSILLDLARAAGWSVDAEIAQALFVGIATDTGWFRHSNTDARALADCAELASVGARPFEIHESFYLRDSAARVRLLGEALATLQLHASDRVAVMCLSQEAFGRASAKPSDTEDIVNEPMRIESVFVSALLVEQGDGVIRVNLRSKPPCGEAGRPDIDVSAVAGLLGGGGHRRAAGARVKGQLDETARQVREIVASQLIP